MQLSGTAMLLKSLGLDPEELQKSIESFKGAMVAAVAKIDANQARIEGKLDQILTAQLERGHTEPVLEDGKATGVLLTTEKFPEEMLRDAGMVNGVVRDGG